MGSAISKLVFQPPEPTYSRDPNLIWLQTSRDNVIPAFFIDRGAKYTILFSHGNAEDLGMIIQYFREVSQLLEVNVFAYEYSGYGMSSGTPSESNVFSDVDAAYKYLTNVVGVPWDRIIMYGRSLGSGPSTYIAHKYPVRGLILQSPLASALRVGFEFRFSLPGDLFRNCDMIADVQCPVYIVHGTRDEIVPLWHGQELFRRAPSPVEPFWVQQGGHNNLEHLARESFYDRMFQFIRYLDQTPVSTELMKQAKSVQLRHTSSA